VASAHRIFSVLIEILSDGLGMLEIIPAGHRAKRVSEPTETIGDPLLTSRRKREHLGGISKMTDWRWSNRDADPLPGPDIVVGRMGLWRLSTLERWIARQPTKK
jgi:hypothetical protein